MATKDTKGSGSHVFHRRAGESPYGEVYEYGTTTDPTTGDTLTGDFLLLDFDIDWDELKSAHTYRLDQAIKFIQADLDKRESSGWEIRIKGYASKTFHGKEASDKDTVAVQHNEILSNMREQRVEEYLNSRVKNTAAKKSIIREWHGFSQTTVRGENKYGRAVRVQLQRPGLPPPPPRELPQEPTPKIDTWDHTFKIRLVGALSASYGAAGIDVVVFEIWAVNRHCAALYRYQGANIGKSLGPVSHTFKGPWNDFTTMREMGNSKWSERMPLEDFDSRFARFTTVGTGSKSLNFLAIQLTYPMVTFPNPIHLNTGFTAGAGASLGLAGILKMSPNYVFPRTTET